MKFTLSATTWLSLASALSLPTDPSSSNATSSDAASYFPSDVGFLGTMISGTPAMLVDNDLINGTLRSESGTGFPVETRWNATDDYAFDIFQNLGNVSPYFSSPLFPDVQSETVLPGGCAVRQVHMLHRHGSRYPTSSTTEGAPHFGSVLKNATGTFNATGPLEFLNRWTYTIGAEVLVPMGRQQLFDSGTHAAYRYGALWNETSQLHKPVVRTTSQSRMLDSAKAWTLGFFGLDAADKVDLEIIIEGATFNNTLASYDTCTNGNEITIGDTYLRPIWEAKYLSNAVARLQPYLQNLTLDTDLVYGMQGLCAYETAALGFSNFCGLFTMAEWQGFEYDLDLQFQGDYGFMSPSGRAQGVGWVSELLARLSSNSSVALEFLATQNSTLDSDPVTFPVDQPLYLDFTHDDIIVSVLAALNYSQVVGDYLDANEPDEARTFVLSHITPFAARLFFEVIDCEAAPASSTSRTTFIRTVLNDALIPLSAAQGCSPIEGLSSTLCPLADFLAFQQAHAVQDANFDVACLGRNGTDFVVDGPVIRNGTIALGFGL